MGPFPISVIQYINQSMGLYANNGQYIYCSWAHTLKWQCSIRVVRWAHPIYMGIYYNRLMP